VKAVNKYEAHLLTKQAEPLFWYADQVFFDKLPSVLAQVVGVFTVTVMRRGRSKQFKRTYIVQRNLRYHCWNNPHTCFDLKGVGKSRKVQSSVPEDKQLDDDDDRQPGAVRYANQDGMDGATASKRPETVAPASKSVLWDQNFREWTGGKPLCLPQCDLKYLEAAVWNDTLLLSGQQLVDYSLLLAAAPSEGPDPTSCNALKGTLSVGLIDYLRPYTFDKQIESAVKGAFHHSSGQPTVIEPTDYSRRFRTAMGTFFVAESPSLQLV
jgi:1-phosphatidylinositol-3-phosphate 5-kinase